MLILLPLLVRLGCYLSYDTRLATVGAAYWYVFFGLFAGKGPLWQQNGTIAWESVPFDGWLFLWALVLIPYFIYQLVRSIVWAVKVLRALSGSLRRT